jgi:hypothetical protein
MCIFHLGIQDRQHCCPQFSSKRSMAAMISGRLLLQPFTSLCSMSAQQRCLAPASLVLGHTHAALQSTEPPKHSQHGKLSTAHSMSAGTCNAVCSALPVYGGVVSPYRSATASAAELPDTHAEQTSVQTKQSHLSARQHQLRRPAASAAVVGWRVRDIIAMDQDIGIVSEVWFATTCGSRRCGPMGSQKLFAVLTRQLRCASSCR